MDIVGKTHTLGAAVDIVGISHGLRAAVDIVGTTHTLGVVADRMDTSQLVGASPQPWSIKGIKEQLGNVQLTYQSLKEQLGKTLVASRITV